MKRPLIIMMSFCLAIILAGCHHETKVLEGAVKDFDGNVYDAVKIGKHIWMKQDIKTWHFAEGSMCIDYPVADFDRSMSSPIRFPNRPLFSKGAIRYLRNTKTPDIGPCPEGWHIPSVAEWEDLIKTVNRNSDWIETSGSVNGAMVEDVNPLPRCESFNSSGFSVLLDGPGSLMLTNNFTGTPIIPHYDQYKCYWALDDGDLTQEGRDVCTYVEFSHPPLGNPYDDTPKIKTTTASKEDGQPLFYVRCVKDKQKRETSWQIITENME
jgi:uncharacterized protein (TIGR02145 family)